MNFHKNYLENHIFFTDIYNIIYALPTVKIKNILAVIIFTEPIRIINAFYFSKYFCVSFKIPLGNNHSIISQKEPLGQINLIVSQNEPLANNHSIISQKEPLAENHSIISQTNIFTEQS